MLLLPNSFFMLLGGAFFGLFWGMALNLAAFTLACALSFLCARYLAREPLRRHIPASMEQAQEKIGHGGWKLVAVLRLVGVLPAFCINYFLGITPVKTWDYLWASAVFTLPNCFVLTYAGLAGGKLLEGDGAIGTQVYIAGLLLAAALLGGAGLRRKLLEPRR